MPNYTPCRGSKQLPEPGSVLDWSTSPGLPRYETTRGRGVRPVAEGKCPEPGCGRTFRLTPRGFVPQHKQVAS